MHQRVYSATAARTSPSGVAAELLRSEGDNRILTSPYNRQTDGNNENSYKRTLAQIRSFATGNSRKWEKLSRQFDAAYNNAPIEGEPFSSNSIFSRWASVGVAGRVISPTDRRRPPRSPSPRRAPRSSATTGSTWLGRRRGSSNTAPKGIATRARRCGATTLAVPFEAGDWVVSHISVTATGYSQKLVDQFQGPFRALDTHASRAGTLAHNVLNLIHVESGATKSANVDRLSLQTLFG